MIFIHDMNNIPRHRRSQDPFGGGGIIEVKIGLFPPFRTSRRRRILYKNSKSQDSQSDILGISLLVSFTLTLPLSHQGRGDVKIELS
jgi:hypothetical protein